jgi:hypothetical protein
MVTQQGRPRCGNRPSIGVVEYGAKLGISFLDRYLFDIKASGPGQGLRPFRDPDAAENNEEEV